MKTLFLLFKEVIEGMEEFFEKHNLVPIYLIVLVISYVESFLVICFIWYIYEIFTSGYLKQNSSDTFTALKWSFLIMILFADMNLKIVNKQLNP